MPFRAIPGFFHCACGDVFRTLDLSSPLGRVFIDYSSKGLLVPDDTTIALWKESIDGQVAAAVGVTSSGTVAARLRLFSLMLLRPCR